MVHLVHELRLAVRSLLKSRGFTMTSIVTLAVALAANAAMFALLRNVVLQPLTFPEPERLVVVAQTVPSQGLQDELLSADDLRQLRERTQLLDRVVGIAPWDANLTGAGEPLRVRASAASAGLFSLLQTPLLLGREFTAQDLREGHSDVVVISEALADGAIGMILSEWLLNAILAVLPGERVQTVPGLSHLGVDRHVLLFTLEVSVAASVAITVVGVAADVFPAQPANEVYLPLAQEPHALSSLSLLFHSGGPATMESVRVALRELDPTLPPPRAVTLAQEEAEVGASSGLVARLMGAYAVLAALLAGLGVYGVNAFTSAQRERELGIRSALGARRQELLALMIRGSLPSIAVGLGIGLALALAMAKVLGHQLEGVVALDLRMIAAASVFLALLALLGSVLPARRASAVDPMTALRTQ